MISNIKDIIPSIREASLFFSLTAGEIEAVLASAAYSKYSQGEFLFFQGDRASTVYLVAEGLVKLSLIGNSGEEVTIQYVGQGEAFALVAAYKKSGYPLTAQAERNSLLVAWPGEELKQLFIAYPQLGLNGTNIIAQRTISFQNRLLELSTEKVERRIAHALLRLAHQVGQKTGRGVLIGMKLTRQDIAQLAGTTLYTVSRTLRKWEMEQVLGRDQRMILIRNPHRLVEYAEDLPSKYPDLIEDPNTS